MSMPIVTRLNETPRVSHRCLRDVDDQAASLDGWQQEYHQLGRGAYEGSLLSLSMKGLDFFVETSNRPVHQSGSPPPGTLSLALPLACEGNGWISGQAVTQETMIALGPKRELDFRTPLSLSVAAIVVAFEELMRYAAVLDSEAAVGLALARGAVALPGLACSHLRESLQSIMRALGGDRVALQHGNALAAFRNSLLSGFLSALSGAAASAPLTSGPRNHRRIVERAVQYMRAHAGEPISVVDICRAADVHSRVLQYCFNEVFGMSPMAYLRCLRLHQVRREIRQSADEPIGDIAARWGIWHLGRLAAEYRALFGELPSATVRGARGS